MLAAGIWRKNQNNTILFVMIDTNGNEFPGLSTSFTLEVSKAGAPFATSLGSKSEVGGGWYKYISSESEADTSGPVAIRVTGAGVVQQNLEYVVDDRVVTAVEFTYTVTSTAGNVPLPGVSVVFYADSLATNLVWFGQTDAFGVARDIYNNKPRLQPGTYYILRDKSGYSFEDPDVETVS